MAHIVMALHSYGLFGVDQRRGAVGPVEHGMLVLHRVRKEGFVRPLVPIRRRVNVCGTWDLFLPPIGVSTLKPSPQTQGKRSFGFHFEPYNAED